MTWDEIERRHQTLEEPHPAGGLLTAGRAKVLIEAFGTDCNHRRYRESIDL